MEKCNCNEDCFKYIQSISNVINDNVYIQKILVNKCNRLVGDNIKKKPCDYLSNRILSEKLIEEPKTVIKEERCNTTRNFSKILTYNDIRDQLKKLLKWYNFPKTNYFGKINYYLKILGYSPHEPTLESLSELEYRISKPPNNKKNLIFINKNALLSKSIGEFDYDYDEEIYISNNIKDGINPFEWLKLYYIQEILKPLPNKNIKTINKKRHKVNKSKSSLSKIELLNVYENNEDTQIIEEESYIEEEKEIDDNEDEEEEKEEKEENDKDNEFDVENYSDEDNDYDENDYDDFSD